MGVKKMLTKKIPKDFPSFFRFLDFHFLWIFPPFRILLPLFRYTHFNWNILVKFDLRFITINKTRISCNIGSPEDSRRKRVCNSAACVIQSAAILSAMDTSADPCQDFYQYACGQWKSPNSLPAKNNYATNFNRLEIENRLHLKKVLGP